MGAAVAGGLSARGLLDIGMAKADAPIADGMTTFRARTGRSFGTAVRSDHFVGTSEAASVIARHCDFIVPEYHSQWSAIEWERGNRWFGDLDRIAGFAAAHDIAMRGHSLIWEQMTPDWARLAMQEPGGWNIVRTHFASMLTRYDVRTLSEWIVVNECIDTEAGDRGFRRTSFQRAFGNDYVRRAFDTARELAPHARLLLNEYALEYDNPVDDARRAALLCLVEHLKARGTPLDGVGVQAHLELAKGRIAAKAVKTFLHDLAQLGVKISITELDVLEADRGEPVAVRDQRVADAVQEFLDVASTEPAVTNVATWGLFDQESWLQDRSTETLQAMRSDPVDYVGLNRGLPFTGDFTPKAMAALVVPT